MQFGIIGLGRMGGGLASQSLAKGIEVVGFDEGGERPALVEKGLKQVETAGDLVAALTSPRIIFLYIPAGPPVDATIEELLPSLSIGDIVVDGGNSYWGDSIHRAKRLGEHGIHWVDLGTSGGISGANTGACFMAGGDADACEAIEPILRQLAVPGGYVYAGPSGCGHYVKLVHNGIEFGMLQAIGEGMQLLEHFDQKLLVEDILSCWQNGSVVRSWLVELMRDQYKEQGGLDSIPPYIEDTGEVNWLVADAMRMEIPIPVIAQSVMQLFTSRDKTQEWSRSVAAMRHGFGGHPFGEDDFIKHERQTGRVGDIYRP